MRRIFGYLATLLALAPQADAATPLEAYGALPTIENVVISPDGTRLALVRTQGEERLVAVVSLATGERLAGARAGDVKLRSIEWAGDEHVLMVGSVTKDVRWLTGGKTEWSLLSVLDVAANTVTAVPKQGVDNPNIISDAPMVREIGSRVILFVPGTHLKDYLLPALYRYDLETGEQTLLERGLPGTRQWFVDRYGAIAGRVSYLDAFSIWGIEARQAGGQYRLVTEGVSAIYEPRILGYGPDGNSMLVTYPRNDGSRLELVPLSDDEPDATWLEQLAEASDPLHDPVTRYLIGGSRTTDRTEYEFVSPAHRDRWQLVLSQFPDAHVRLESASRDFAKIVVRFDGPKAGFGYALLDLETRAQYPLGPVYPAIAERHETRAISYAAADGLAISGYLTVPSGKADQDLPLVVLVHGGPQARDTADFDWWPQALASQGYAVLQANFRGSLLSTQFMETGFGEWGRKMQTDLSDGVRYLAEQGTIDPARVCIMGASYGGYAALAGVTLDPGVYRCAVSVAGIADIERMLTWQQSNSLEREQRFWSSFMGVDGPTDPGIDAISPAEHAADVTVPVLLVHGKDDTVVPYEQSEAMLRALRRAGKQVELVTLKREDHWLSRGETRTQMLQASTGFLRQHNPPN